MHMPGHKRTPGGGALDCAPYRIDLTEIPGTDDLNDPRGIIAESEKLASSLWGSDRTFYSVNGSTACVLAAVYSICPPGRPVIVARNCHRSVYHALEISRADPVFVSPGTAECGIRGSLSPDAVETALSAHPDASAVILTSPTYEGVISDIRGICRAAHGRGVPVIVDEAHGAHLGLFGVFPAGAVEAGADVVIHSLHKTLRALTQTAVLHVSGGLADADGIARAMAVFTTSSPSYVLISSIDGEVRSLANGGGELLSAWREALRAPALRGPYEKISVPDLSADPAVFDADPSKIYIDSHRSGVTGEELSALLRNAGVEIEALYPYGALAMTGEGDSGETLRRFADALREADRAASPGRPAVPRCTVTVPPRAMAPDEAARRVKVRVPLSEAEGRISGAYVFSYPPGVPFIIPGEIFTRDAIDAIGVSSLSGARLSGVEEGTVAVLEK